MPDKPTYAELERRVCELESVVAYLNSFHDDSNKPEDSFSDIVKNAVIGIYRVTREGRFVFVNPRLAEIFGYTSPEAFLSSVSNILNIYKNPEDRLPILQKIDKKGFLANCEARFRKRDGQRLWIRVNARSVRDDRWGVVYEGFMTDISEQKQAESLLKRSEERYRITVDSAPCGILVHDLDDHVLIYNSQMEMLTGYTSKEIPDTQSWFEKLYPDKNYRKELLQDRREKVQERQIRIRKATITRKNGKKRICRFASILLPLGNRIVFVIDITDQRQAEAALRNSRDVFEQRVIERTAELVRANESLKKEIDQRKVTEAALEIKSKSLEEVNTALRVLLDKKNQDRQEIEEKMFHNVKQLVLPYIEKLAATDMDMEQKAYIDVLASNLNDIMSPFSQSLSAMHMNLTRSEIRIADLLRKGGRTKEIAELLSLSERTIETHRKNIRKRLGLIGRNANLRTYLLSIKK